MTGSLPRPAVPAAFDAVAGSYDRLVGSNPGYHAALRRAARVAARAGDHLLDLGCGTGASTRALLEAAPGARVVAVDASVGMLAEAARKSWPPTVRFVHRGVERLPDDDVGGPFDAVFAAYLLRNLADPDAALRAWHELLRPGGLLVLQDYSLADRRLPRLVWHAVCWTVIIPMARVAAGQAGLYRYLWRSVREFDSPPALVRRLRTAGFVDVGTFTSGGWQRGIVHTVVARREAP